MNENKVINCGVNEMCQKKHKFTIITVCYNSGDKIKRTIQSVIEQKYTDYEYIIKDGASSDDTIRIINSCVPKNENIKIISEPDCGIYDAMNKAVGKAHGEYVFLNAGDYFINKNILQEIEKFIIANCNNKLDTLR